MLEFAQIEAGNYQMNIDTFDLVNVIKHCMTPHKKKAMEKHLDLKTSFQEESILVEIDLQCAESVINNLLDNAVKFTRQGFVDIEIGVYRERELAVCKVKDTGIGISTEYLDHLYQPFSQEDLDVGRTFEGNGLGLAISKRYVERMGGSLIVDSIKGVGTTFTFTLPLAKVSATASRSVIRRRGEKINGRAKILMLDDAGESYELIKAFLKEEFEIELVNYHNFNTSLIEQEKFSAIIFDVTKNYWDKGLDFCRMVKSSNPNKTPLVILSSEFLNEKIQQFYRAGADEFLVKPFAKNVLVSLINRITSPLKTTHHKN
jgi:CheY-like chemotaxis protein